MKQSFFKPPMSAIGLIAICLFPMISISAPMSIREESGSADTLEAVDASVSRPRYTTFAAGSDPNEYRPPAGNVLYRTAGNTCLGLTTTTWLDVFGGDIDFTTGPASSLVEVNYYGQASIGVGPNESRLYFKCTISQDGGSSWQACSGSGGTNGVIFARRTTYYDGTKITYGPSTASGTYIGYLSGLQTSTATKVRLQARVQLDNNGNSGQLCASNVIIRY